MSQERKDLLELILNLQSTISDPKIRDLAGKVAQDVANLNARALKGEDVTTELAIANATATNLDSKYRNMIMSTILQWSEDILAKALALAIIA